MFGRCSVCSEKEFRIKDLLSQVEMLKKLAFPQQDLTRAHLEAREFDQLMSGSSDVITINTSDEELEVANILTGMHDSSQVAVE